MIFNLSSILFSLPLNDSTPMSGLANTLRGQYSNLIKKFFLKIIAVFLFVHLLINPKKSNIFILFLLIKFSIKFIQQTFLLVDWGQTINVFRLLYTAPTCSTALQPEQLAFSMMFMIFSSTSMLFIMHLSISANTVPK